MRVSEAIDLNRTRIEYLYTMLPKWGKWPEVVSVARDNIRECMRLVVHLEDFLSATVEEKVALVQKVSLEIKQATQSAELLRLLRDNRTRIRPEDHGWLTLAMFAAMIDGSVDDFDGPEAIATVRQLRTGRRSIMRDFKGVPMAMPGEKRRGRPTLSYRAVELIAHFKEKGYLTPEEGQMVIKKLLDFPEYLYD